MSKYNIFDYLKSKWYLGIIGTTVMTIMDSFIYSYFGIFYIVTIICAGLYNLGINSYVTLWAGAFNKSAIDLILIKMLLEIKNLLIPKQC